MVHRDALIAEFDQEMAATRLLIERLPEEAFGWAPHEGAYSLAGLATHLAELPQWGRAILEHDHHDLTDDRTGRGPVPATRAEVLDVFDRHAGSLRTTLTRLTDGELQAPWSLRRGRTVLMSLPRISAFRRFFVHHLVHHRGQLTVYLQMQHVTVPPMYGPAAHERP